MKRGIRLLFLASLSALSTGSLVWLAWTQSQKPAMIPYEAWAVPRDPEFPLARCDPDPVQRRLRNDEIMSEDDFVFTMGVGSGMYGLDVFRVDASGDASYVFSTDRDAWWAVEFKATAAEVVKLRQLLVDIEFANLASGYHGDVCDGTQWCIRLDVAGITKRVYCNNYFPGATQKLANAISRELLPAHEAELKKARRIWESSAKTAAADLWGN
jgi:hypothetical protein